MSPEMWEQPVQLARLGLQELRDQQGQLGRKGPRARREQPELPVLGCGEHKWIERNQWHERHRVRRHIYNFTYHRNGFGIVHHAKRFGILRRSAGSGQFVREHSELHGRSGYLVFRDDAGH